MFRSQLATLCAALAVSACGSDDSTNPASDGPVTSETGVFASENGWIFRTQRFTLGPGEERSSCFAADTPMALSVKRFRVSRQSVVHHFLLSSVDGTREPYGESECDALFKRSWRPMFVAGAGHEVLDIPDGAARFVDPGTQLVLRAHLANASRKTVTERAELSLESTTESDPSPVGVFAFGAFDFALPPKQSSSVESLCEVRRDVQLFAMMPHMHYLGRKLALDLGAGGSNLTPAYRRDPYDFDQQTIEPFRMTIKAGTQSRITCSYNNDRDQTITFGESTTNEMCVAFGFTVNQKGSAAEMDGCFGQTTPPQGI